MAATDTTRRRTFARWCILRALQASRPIGANETTLRRALGADFPHLNHGNGMHAELEMMNQAGLVELIDQSEFGAGFAARLSHYGIRVVEFSCAAPAGIGRPENQRMDR